MKTAVRATARARASASAVAVAVLRIALLVLVSALALQLYFVARVALAARLDPESTAFQRSEAWRLLVDEHALPWRRQWVGYDAISVNLKRAVIASEDAGFTGHAGFEWDALERAWLRNQKAQARADMLAERIGRRALKAASSGKPAPATVPPKIVGGSTITQQLAKNLFLAGERNLLRKGQEFVIAFLLERLLSKQRILEIYLNHVEWGEGVFGAEAAARHYFRVGAGALGPAQAARLAVMLPAPKRFEKRHTSADVLARAATVVARMGAVAVP